MAPTNFVAALLSDDLHAVRACPKADLHTHGLANADRDYVREKTGRDIAPIEEPLASMDDMHAWAKANIGDFFDGQQGRMLGLEASFVRAYRIRLNVCPTSNLLLGRVARLQDHPIRKLFDAGVKVTVNTDDAIVFGVGVSEEFLRLHQVGVFTATELDVIRQWGLRDD